ncbi:helix-turn-helix domain-containing protein [Sphingobium sp. AS12]|uniref:helix-turn-helix domain-containing protein n=1 Tax=Sphingobium sp. AS12 TaxID=2849495 RepID=UPI001C31A58B|nr:helix-turn-helix domain-containing protein [Sphingobium sp. AS12]MBV2146748.1 helix-turn-helix domain-containing protein [Sphingobium sp. AS12]
MLSQDLIAGATAAATYAGLTPRAIYHLVEAGHLPVIRKGKRLYFRKSELEAAFRSDAVNG